jgi:hypothetical protein
MIEIRGLFEAHVDGVSLSATDRKRAEARRKLKLAPVSSQTLVRTARDGGGHEVKVSCGPQEFRPEPESGS